MDRREFIRDCGRNLLIGGLVFSGWKLLQGRISAPTGQTCVNRGICKTCGAFEKCGLPQALSAKRYRGETGKNKETATDNG